MPPWIQMPIWKGAWFDEIARFLTILRYPCPLTGATIEEDWYENRVLNCKNEVVDPLVQRTYIPREACHICYKRSGCTLSEYNCGPENDYEEFRSIFVPGEGVRQ